MPTTYNQFPIFLKSPTYNVDAIPAPLKNTHRALMKFAHALYVSDVDLTFTVYWKGLYTNVENSKVYTMSKDKEYFKQKFPRGILAREWRYEIAGTDATICEITEAGLMWLPHPIGGR